MGASSSAPVIADKTLLRRQRHRTDAAKHAAAVAKALAASPIPAELTERVLNATVTELLAMLAAGAVTSVQLVNIFTYRCTTHGYALRAVTDCCYTEALAAAAESDARRSRGEAPRLLEGIPVSIKEHIEMRGYDATCGMATFANVISPADAVIVKTLKDAGAIPIVRSNVPQLLMLPESDNALFGNAINPWDATRTPGGSSGGEGALVAARCSPLGVGTDIGGSIRIPSHYCGIVGFKPTAGRVSSSGVKGCGEEGVEGQILVPCTAGPMARCVDDVVLVMRSWSVPRAYAEDVYFSGREFNAEVYAPPAPRRLRIGVFTDDKFATPAAACLRAVKEAADALRAAGHEVVPWRPSEDHGLDTYRAACNYYAAMAADGGMRCYKDALAGESVIALYKPLETIANIPGWVRPAAASVLRMRGMPRMADLATRASAQSAYDLFNLSSEVIRYRNHYIKAWKEAGLDLVLCPGLGLPATPHGMAGDLSVTCSWTFQWNLLNFPAGTLPATLVRPDEVTFTPPEAEADDFGHASSRAMAGSAGLPVGVQLVGLPNADELVLYGMKQLESALTVRDVATAGATLGAAAAAAAAATTTTTAAAAGGVSDVVSKTTTPAAAAAAATGGAGALTDPTPPSTAAPAGTSTAAAPAGATGIPVAIPRLRGFCPEHVLLKTVAAVPPSVSLA